MRHDLSISLAAIFDTRFFAPANAGLITVRYTLACNARSFSWFEFARHFESHLARPPPFYMRMQTRRLPINIPLLLCYTVHVLYSQPIRLIGIISMIHNY